MNERIVLLVLAGLNVQMYTVPGVSAFTVDIYDPSIACAKVALAYDWQHHGDVDATLEAAVSKAEAYLRNRADGVKGAA